jgi:hypothetical protein
MEDVARLIVTSLRAAARTAAAGAFLNFLLA